MRRIRLPLGGSSFSTSSVFTYSGGAAGLAEVAALSSTPRCTPFAGVIAILLRPKNWALVEPFPVPASADATLDRKTRRQILRC
jgi:hypothetical protein